jgi:arylsulfatase A-like enzyme
VITLDTTRADRLGCYGCSKGLTPSLDAFAQKCFLFKHCEAPRPQTVPSHTSLFSGWDPIRHGVRKNLEEQVPSGVPLIAQEFRRSGYATAAFISSFVLLPHYGLGRGFQTYDTSFFDTSNPQVTERRAARTLQAALPWIQKQRAPWFCWVHLYDPHYPYEPPEPFTKRYADAPYDGEVAYMDDALGAFLGALEARGLLASTAVVICADHGEGLGDHGEKMHGVFLYEATTHVPLLIRLPGQSARTTVADDVGLVDVAPTLRELCGLPPVPGDGVSLRPLFHGEALGRKAVYLESLETMYNFSWARR